MKYAPLEVAVAEYVKAFTADVRAFPNAYKASVVANPEATALTHVDHLMVPEIISLTRDQWRETARSRRELSLTTEAGQ